MSKLRPNATTAAAAAFHIATMPADEAAALMRDILVSTKSWAMTQRGLGEQEAGAFAAAFGDAVVDAMRSMPSDGAVH